jgi:hypothetical protein
MKKGIMRISVLHNTSPDIRMMKSRRTKWAWNVARMRDDKCLQNVGRNARRDKSKYLGVDERTILKWSLGKTGFLCELYSSGSGQGPLACSCEHGDETSGNILNV